MLHKRNNMVWYSLNISRDNTKDSEGLLSSYFAEKHPELKENSIGLVDPDEFEKECTPDTLTILPSVSEAQFQGDLKNEIYNAYWDLGL